MIAYTRDKGIRVISSTNGHAFAKKPGLSTEVVRSGLDMLIFSLDGLEQESYEQFRQRGAEYRKLRRTFRRDYRSLPLCENCSHAFEGADFDSGGSIAVKCFTADDREIVAPSETRRPGGNPEDTRSPGRSGESLPKLRYDQ